MGLVFWVNILVCVFYWETETINIRAIIEQYLLILIILLLCVCFLRPLLINCSGIVYLFLVPSWEHLTFSLGWSIPSSILCSANLVSRKSIYLFLWWNVFSSSIMICSFAGYNSLWSFRTCRTSIQDFWLSKFSLKNQILFWGTHLYIWCGHSLLKIVIAFLYFIFCILSIMWPGSYFCGPSFIFSMPLVFW